uniref:Uncharacterized protein n=1 Tax=Anguilla anguilla TaxID=7936 RepID=A0A0E9RPJ6_ANGAN
MVLQTISLDACKGSVFICTFKNELSILDCFVSSFRYSWYLVQQSQKRLFSMTMYWPYVLYEFYPVSTLNE